MRILVTGSRGILGRAVQAALAADGHDLVLLDQRREGGPPSESEFTTVVADIRDPATYVRHLQNADAVVHLASLHGRDHMSRFDAAAFWSVNVEGTRSLYDAAAQAGIRHVVLASSMAVYGPIPGAPQRNWIRRTERTRTVSHDSYALTKLVCEQIAVYHAHQSSMATTVLRFGHFTPTTMAEYGLRLLFGGVDVRDAATAVGRALISPPGRTQVRRLNIHAPSPLTTLPLEVLSADPQAPIREHYPEMTAHLEQRGGDLSVLLWGRSVWPIDLARNRIGYHPQWTFERFVDSFCRDDERSYEPLTWHRWGVDAPLSSPAASA